MLTTTNAVKAQIIATVNAALGLLAAFNVASLTDTQKGALLVAVNAVLALVVAVTYKASVKRLPDPVVAAPLPVVVPAASADSPPPVLAAATVEELQAALAARKVP